MNVRRSLVAISAVAALHATFFIGYQRADWKVAWSDQAEYQGLGTALAATGSFTPFPGARPFVPEVIRTPGYPLFLALVYTVAGRSQLAVVVAQAVVFVAVCLLAYAIARSVAPRPVAVASAALTSAFAPIPYFGALIMTEVWTTFLVTASIWLAVLATRRPSAARVILLGFAFAAASLTRPAFVLLPFGLCAVWLVWLPLTRVRKPSAARDAALLVVAFVIGLTPWLAYNQRHLGRATLSPAGGVGRGIWEGSWQGVWPGRLQNELTELADETPDRTQLDVAVTRVAEREQRPSAPMLDYVHQWHDIRQPWTNTTDPAARARGRIEADREYLRVGLENDRERGLADFLKRRMRGLVILWAGEIPFRYTAINHLSPIVIRACIAIQLLLLAAALVGMAALACDGHAAEAAILALPIVYVSVVHFPLLTEARQSLPAMPTVLVLAAAGVNALVERARATDHLPSNRKFMNANMSASHR